MTSPTKGLVERLEEDAEYNFGFANGVSNLKKPLTDNAFGKTCSLEREAATAIREALSVIAQAESLIRDGGIVPIKGEAWSRLNDYLWKYQPEDK